MEITLDDFFTKLQNDYIFATGKLLPNYQITEIASRVLTYTNCNLCPLDINELANKLDFKIVETKFLKPHMKAVISIDKKNEANYQKSRVIKVLQEDDDQTKRFEICYLLAQYIMNSQSKNMYYSVIQENTQFAENYYKLTKELLLEEKTFSGEFNQVKDLSRTEKQLATTLSNKFLVSEDLVIERMNDLKLNY